MPQPDPADWLPRERWPRITVQLPMYNESSVAARIIEACVRLDYPRDLLDIQVLDDSTDHCRELAAQAVEAARLAGVDIQLLHRTNRQGFKAGALAAGMPSAKGELIAIFDADFVPEPDFLQRIVVRHRAFDEPEVGYAQARWTYRNRDANALTRSLAMIMDIHFFSEKPGRYRHGFMDNFNGSGGLWRRSCITDAGGWKSDTLTEDFDLSYRAELTGWRGVYFIDVEAPNDLPETVCAFKRQQQRWARGTSQCLRKLTGNILASDLSWRQKTMGILHIAGYLAQPLSLLIMLVWPPLMLSLEVPWPPTILDVETVWILLPFNVILGPMWVVPMLLFYLVHRSQGGTFSKYVRDLPIGILVGMGLVFAGAVAVSIGLFSRQAGVFERTPKARGSRKSGELRLNWTVWGEVAMLVYCLGSFVLLLWLGYGLWAGTMIFYGSGFVAIFALQMREWLARPETPAPQMLELADAAVTSQ